MNIKLALDVESAACCKLLEDKESWLDFWMQLMNIRTKITSGYLGGLSPACGSLPSPGLNYSLSCQPKFSSGGGTSRFSHTQYQLLQECGCED